MTFTFESLGVVRTPYHDTFGIPRQPGLVASARGVVKLKPDQKLRAALRELDTFSHVWIVFVFHKHGDQEWKAAIRPPRLGGSRRVGVLASRSPHRPNPIGMSAVRLERVDLDAAGGPELHVLGVDLLDGTPVLDIKPYLPYADHVTDANAGWAAEPIARVEVTFAPGAWDAAGAAAPAAREELRSLISETLALDPRPASQQKRLSLDDPASEGLVFGLVLLGHDVGYEIRDRAFLVTTVKPKL